MMRNLKWERSKAIRRLRRDVWRFISRAASHEVDQVLWASALLQMPAAEVRFLARLHFILSAPVGQLLVEMPSLHRRLTTTTLNEEEVSAERIRGSIRWSATFATRAASGAPHVFVTAPTRRAFDTPENRVLVFALGAIADFQRQAGSYLSSGTGGVAQEIARRTNLASRWRQARGLVDLPSGNLSPTTIARVKAGRNRRRYQTALDVVELHRRYIARLDRHAVREAVERHALVDSRDSVLLELQCAFDLMSALRKEGWKAPPTGLLRPPLIFRGTSDGEKLEVFFQHTPEGLNEGSRYGQVQTAHGIKPVSRLLPDLVIKLTAGEKARWLLVEVKGGPKRLAADNVRAALVDLLAYRRAFDRSLAGQVRPYGIGYAWGAELASSPTVEVALCTPDRLRDVVARELRPGHSRWPAPEGP